VFNPETSGYICKNINSDIVNPENVIIDEIDIMINEEIQNVENISQ
jgi:hypothetical protein